jgi:hypothetical protein
MSRISGRAALRGIVLPLATAALAAFSLTACSSDDVASQPAEAVDAAESAAGVAGDAAMESLCSQMVSAGMTPEEATALAEDNGYVARVGTLEGEPQAVTMDYREDRFTFDVEGGVVVSCTYG